MTLGRFMKGAALAAVSAAAAWGESSFAAEPMDCAMIAFGADGDVAAAGGARLERGVSASPGMRGTLTLPRDGAEPVTGAWEDGAAVLFIGAERTMFSGREYAGRPGTDTRVLAGRLDGRPVFFSCDPASGSAPAPAPIPAPAPEPAPEPVPDRDAEPAPPPVDEGAWRTLTVPFQSAIDLDAGQVDQLDGSSDLSDAEIVLLKIATPALLVTASVRIGPPADGPGSLEARCRAVGESGDWTRQAAIPLDAAALGAVICVETTEGALGVMRVDRIGEADAGFSYQMFGRPPPRLAEDAAWRSLTAPFSSAIDLDAGRIDRLDGSSDFPDADLILVNLGNPALLVQATVRTGPPTDGPGAYSDRCRAARESGDWTRQVAIPLDAAALGTVLCVETNRRAFGAIRIDRAGEADVALSYQVFARGGPG